MTLPTLEIATNDVTMQEGTISFNLLVKLHVLIPFHPLNYILCEGLGLSLTVKT